MNTILSRSGFVGHTTNRERVYVTVELRQHYADEQHTTYHNTVTEYVELSITGTVKISGLGHVVATGQVIDHLFRINRPADGWSMTEIVELAKLWKRWNLNGVRAGCAHQTPAVAPQDHPDPTGYILDRTPACPQTGYQYGSAWLVEPLPADVIDRVTAFANNLDGTE